jgi:hypothetical protein
MRIKLAGAVIAALVAVPVAGAQASITVANDHDSGPGSLRQAIVDAAAGETIVVPADTYTLTGGELAIAKSLTITGHAASDTIVRSGGTSRVFHTTGAANTVVISGITISDGRVAAPGGVNEGGGVWNTDATLTLTDTIVRDNVVNNDGSAGGPGGIPSGGGIANDSGTLTLLRTQVLDNTARANGGDGTAGGGGPGGIPKGGGLMSTGAVTITDSSFTGNAALATGGAGAASSNGGPGGISYGAGAYISPGSHLASISGSTFTANVANSSGGAAGFGGTAGLGGPGQGGGLWATATSTLIPITNSTVVGNVVRSSGTAAAQGGGLWASGSGSGKVVLKSVTLTANTATGTSGAAGGNLDPIAQVEARNTIISAGVSTAGKENCAVPAASLGHNLEDRTPSQCGLSVSASDRIGSDPLLGPLQDNGGPTRTTALSAGSPAADAGDGNDCPRADQRGLVRPQGTTCDIGAYEAAPGAAVTGEASAVATQSATLAGQATNPDLAAGSTSFQYGTTTSYGLSTPPAPDGPGASATAFAASITGLTPNTTWHFRAVVTNAAGTAFGADGVFVTAAPPPLVAPPAAVPLGPVLSGLSLSPSRLRASASGASIATSIGGRVRYRLSKAASVRFRVERRVKGRLVRRRCVAPTRSNAARKRCTRYVTLSGSFTQRGKAGANTFMFRGRLAGHRLKPGAYRLRAVATDPAGKASVTRRVRFRIVRR